MGYLHELISVEKSRKVTALRILKETTNLFKAKLSHFKGIARVYNPFDENGETLDEESLNVVTSVQDKLRYFNTSQIKLFDTIIQKEKTNSKAMSDIIIHVEDGDDILIGKDVPVQAIVQIEKYLMVVREGIYDNIPTLDPKLKWVKDEQRGDGYWRTESNKKRRTKKVEDVRVVVPATEHHPAQTHKYVTDTPVGNWVETNFSGMMSPAEKSNILERVELMLEAVKKARARANKIKTEPGKIGKSIFDFITE